MKTKITPELHLPVRADFQLEVDEKVREIRIIDEDLGNMSVTNDLERVLLEVSHHIDGALPDYAIVYRDSTGTWDRIVVTADKTFVHTFDVEIKPGRGPDPERRDPMARRG